MIHTLARDFAIARKTNLQQRIEALTLLNAALTIDLASAAVRASIPAARMLLRNPIDLDVAAEFISNSAEIAAPFQLSDYDGWDEDDHEAIEEHAASYFGEIGASDTYRYALMSDGLVRPVHDSVEDHVEQLCGLRFRDLLRLARDYDLGGRWQDLATDPEYALRLMGWDKLARGHVAIKWDERTRFFWKGGERASSNLYWIQRVLDWWDPSLLHVETGLREVEPRVAAALSVVQDRLIPWDLDGLSVIRALSSEAEEDLGSACVDLVEIDTRTLLDENEVIGTPTALIVGSPDDGSDAEDQRWVPIRVVAGTLPLLDFFDPETDTAAAISHETWRFLDNVLAADLVEVEADLLIPVSGIEAGGMAIDSLMVDQVAFNGFRRLEFSRLENSPSRDGRAEP